MKILLIILLLFPFYSNAQFDGEDTLHAVNFKTTGNSVFGGLIGSAHLASADTYISGTGTAGTDNTATTIMTITLAANKLTQVGDRVRIRCYWSGTTGTNLIGTAKLNNVTISHTTDGGAASMQINEVWLHYIDNTHANIIEMENGTLGDLSAANVAGFSWNTAQDLIFTQNQASSNHAVLYAIIIDYMPKGSY